MNLPLIMIPGWCLGRGPLQATVNALNAEFLDLPGYGTAPRHDQLDEAIAAMADALPEACIVAGWSLGAQLAIQLANYAPEKVKKIVMIAGTASFIQRPGWLPAMAPETLNDFTNAIATDPEGMLPRFVGGFNRGDKNSKQVTQEILTLADPRPPASTLVNGLFWLKEMDLREKAANTPCPALILHGANDPLMPASAAEALATLIPQSTLVMIESCAHAPFLSEPAICVQHIQDFLND